jgi:hypothetical protein
MPIQFTAIYDDLVNDNTDSSGDISAVPSMGPVYFVPTLLPGYRIPALTNLPRPAGIGIRAFEGFIDTDGRLKSAPGGDIGVRLWANDPDWNLPRLQYQVRAELTDGFGIPVPWNAFYFDAPDADLNIDLGRELPPPGQKFGRGRSGFGVGGLGVTGEGQLQLSREDGLILGSVTVPELSETLTETNAGAVAYAVTFGA